MTSVARRKQPVFKAVMSRVGVFTAVLDAMTGLVTDVNMRLCETGLNVSCLDSSGVAYLQLDLRPASFVKYRCDRSLTLGIKLTALEKLMKCANADDVLRLSAALDDDTLQVEFESPARDRAVSFGLNTLVIDEQLLVVPPFTPDAVLRMNAADLARILRDIATLGDTCVLSIDDETRAVFHVQGDIGGGTLVVRAGPQPDPEAGVATTTEAAAATPRKRRQSRGGGGVDEDDDGAGEQPAAVAKGRRRVKANVSVRITCRTPVSMTLSTRYLVLMAKGAALSERVCVSMLHNRPVCMKFDLSNGSTLVYYLAGKIVADEDDDQRHR